MLETLRGEGFVPYFAQQRTKTEDKRAYAKHVLRFRHEGYLVDHLEVGDVVPEVVLLNSHNGSSSYRMLAGLFRLVCANGLVVGNSFEEVRVRHTGDVIGRVVEGAYKVLAMSQKVIGKVAVWQSLPLSRERMFAFAKDAHALRFPEPANAPIDPPRLLQARRRSDAEDQSLWGIFNRVQENLIRGGQYGTSITADGRRRNTRVRPINSIDRDTAINRALWDLAEQTEIELLAA
jgi:hypothetical protein